MNKLISLTTVIIMGTTGLALAAEDPSGRPGKVLDEAECQKAWKAAGPDGDVLSEEKATPYIVNFPIVDTSNDREISADEWKAGCKAGWVSADARKVTPKDYPAGYDAKQSGEPGLNDSDSEQ